MFKQMFLEQMFKQMFLEQMFSKQIPIAIYLIVLNVFFKVIKNKNHSNIYNVIKIE